MKVFTAIVLAFALGAGAMYFIFPKLGDLLPSDEASSTLWTCSMHPQVLEEEPGNCPICAMKLTPVERSTAPEPDQLWTCSMHPQVLEDEPGQCPICAMDLVPVERTASSTTAGAQAEAPGGKPPVHVSKSFLQNFGVRTVVAKRGSIPLDFSSVGTLRFNEQGIVSVNTKYGGWIEKAHVNYLGEPVDRGQLLFEVYSPELVTAQKEYLAALEYVDQLSATARPDAIERARSLLDAAAERLSWWDVSTEQIRELAGSKSVRRTLPVRAPAAGLVVEKMGDSLEGMRLTPGMTVFKIADMTTIWADVELYEHQLRHVRLGQQVAVTVSAFPGRRWTGKVVYLAPEMVPQTRTLAASVEIDNRDGLLRPEMFVEVAIRRPATAGVTVPEEVVLRTGTRSIVIVEREPGLYEPREVELGPAGDGRQEIRRGLQPGEVVVASSQFLIDSESNLRAAIDQMLTANSDAQAPMSGHQH